MLRPPTGSGAGSFPRLQIAGAAVSLLLLASCQTTGSNLEVFGVRQTLVLGEDVVLPGNPRALGQDGVQATLRMVMELDRQKKFSQARYLLSQVRAAQPPSGQGYQAVTSSMAVLALKESNFGAFKRLARQLDMALGTPGSVASQHLEVVSLYRVVEGKTPPVNAPANIKMLRDRYLAVQSAKSKRN